MRLLACLLLIAFATDSGADLKVAAPGHSGFAPAATPAVRTVVRHAQAQDYRFSSLVLGIVRSDPFLMRVSQ